MTKHKSIIYLASKLVGNHIEAKVIEDSLKIIVDEFELDCGFVYEVDQLNVFHLKETYSKSQKSLPSFFVLDKSESNNISKNIEPKVININSVTDSWQKQMLELFDTKILVILALADESDNLCGIIAFTNANEVNLNYLEDNFLFAHVHMLGQYVNIRLYQNKLLFAQNSLENILDNTGIDIYVNDFNTHEILYANQSMARPYGGKQNFYGRKCWEVLYPEQHSQCEFCPQKNLLDENGDPSKVYSWNYQRPFDGSWFRVFSASFRWMDGRLAHVVSSADITENKRNEELIKYIANYDSLTKLPNRRMLIADCENMINQPKGNQKCYVLFFDIDGFKKINDEHGHDAGDEFLVLLGEFLSKIPLFKNSIYRNGGDEFVGLLKGDFDDFSVKNLINFIHERFQKPWNLKNFEVNCNTSIGISCFPNDGNTTEILLSKADKAMYYAKKHGPGQMCFSSELEAKH